MALTQAESDTLATELFGGASPLNALYLGVINNGQDVVARSAALADLINDTTTNRTVIRPTMPGREVRALTNAAEFLGLTEHKRAMFLTLATADEVDSSSGSADEDLIKWVFGAGSVTVQNLATARLQTVSRAAELGLPEVKAADVQAVFPGP